MIRRRRGMRPRRVRQTHRPTLPPAEYQALVARIFARQRQRCAFCGRARQLDPHHVLKRSRGGPDHEDNIVGLCRVCHDRTDWPFAKGRLLIVALGGGFFAHSLIFAKDKWAHALQETPAG